MTMLPYKLSKTKDLLTSRAGLVYFAQLLNQLGWSSSVDTYFPGPKSNRGFKPSVFVNTLLLMLHDGGRCLDDLSQLRDDQALRQLLGLKQVPQPDTMGDWLRRQGKAGLKAATEVNRHLLKQSLAGTKKVTLDIDATLVASRHREAAWTYKGCQGYFPIVGYIAQTGQLLSAEFRPGNTPPSGGNSAFIQQCAAALPKGTHIARLRSDAAGYQVQIIDDCIDQGIEFAIRAKMNRSLKKQIKALPESAWQPHGETEQTCTLTHTMEKSRHAFTLVIQRKQCEGQLVFDLDDQPTSDSVTDGGYIYRAIATNLTRSNETIVRWYNQRAEAAENRIKELKNDFGAGRVPCADFDASALYFFFCGLAQNLFVMMKSYLPDAFKKKRAKAVRYQLYAIAAKVVSHGRQWYLKVSERHYKLLATIHSRLTSLAQAPPCLQE